MTTDFQRDYELYCKTRIGKRAVTFDGENPKVWELFLKFAREISLTGRKRYSVNMIFERIRWHTTVETKGEFKLSNDFRAYYARKIMSVYPEFRGFFTTREIRQ